MAKEDLAHQAQELLSMTGGSAARSLNQLVGLVSRQVPGCSGATSTVWHDDEPLARAASHPDLAELFELQLTAGSAPWLDALASNATITCPDTLEERRWPGFAAAALARGVRCCVTLVQRSGERALTLTMFGARPRSLYPDQLPLAEILVAFGGAVMGNAAAYDGVQRTVVRLRDSVESGALLDQARGVLMDARGCTAAEALENMRAMATARHVTMTEIAQQVIASQGAGMPEAGAG